MSRSLACLAAASLLIGSNMGSGNAAMAKALEPSTAQISTLRIEESLAGTEAGNPENFRRASAFTDASQWLAEGGRGGVKGYSEPAVPPVLTFGSR